MHFSVGDYILDIVQNAVEAGSRETGLGLAEADNRIEVRVVDSGRGMNEIELAKAIDPYYTDGTKHPGRRYGLGLPFLAQAAEAAGGGFSVTSAPGRGTTVEFSFDPTHIDCPPLGDIPATLLSAMLSVKDGDLVVTRSRGNSAYEIRKSELAEALGDFDTAASLKLAEDYLRSQEEGL